MSRQQLQNQTRWCNLFKGIHNFESLGSIITPLWRNLPARNDWVFKWWRSLHQNRSAWNFNWAVRVARSKTYWERLFKSICWNVWCWNWGIAFKDRKNFWKSCAWTETLRNASDICWKISVILWWNMQAQRCWNEKARSLQSCVFQSLLQRLCELNVLIRRKHHTWLSWGVL